MLIVTPFRAEVVAYLMRYAGQDEARAADATTQELAASTEQYHRALVEEQQRTAVLARELTAATEQYRRELAEERGRRATRRERNGDRTTKCGRITPLRLPELITLFAGLAAFRCGYLSIIVKAPCKGASEILMKPW